MTDEVKTWSEAVKYYNKYFENTEKRLKNLEDWAGESFREWLARQDR